jgi:hypothetical protein
VLRAGWPPCHPPIAFAADLQKDGGLADWVRYSTVHIAQYSTIQHSIVPYRIYILDYRSDCTIRHELCKPPIRTLDKAFVNTALVNTAPVNTPPIPNHP